MARLIGIDFSGDAKKWSGRTARSNVWIADGYRVGGFLEISDLFPVQKLGSDNPFERLIDFLNSAQGAYAAIDAPFSLPNDFLSRGHSLLWELAATWPKEGRPFARGQTLVSSVLPSAGKHGAKHFRATEQYWRRQKLNVRSALWCGPRGGAPFASASFTLLSRHRGPVWPFREAGVGATLCEAFPAAQLRYWSLPFEKYNGREPFAIGNRRLIIEGLKSKHGLRLGKDLDQACEDSADALDAIVCVFAAEAVASKSFLEIDHPFAKSEGHIAVLR